MLDTDIDRQITIRNPTDVSYTPTKILSPKEATSRPAID
jgi:hypothetical protein